MMTWLPFICIGIGMAVGFRDMPGQMMKAVDFVTNASLVVLMLTLGCNIGSNDELVSNVDIIGFRCLVIAIFAILGSILCVLFLERTVLPLEKIRQRLADQKMSIGENAEQKMVVGENLEKELSVERDVKPEAEEGTGISPLIWLMPVCIIGGIILGYLLMPKQYVFILDHTLIGSLIVLYLCVGISMGANRGVFRFVKVLGWKIVLIALAIMGGSILGGLLSGMVLGMPLHTAILPACGMGYYSITGAYLTQNFGAEVGTYGFLVNVCREFFTILLVPLAVKISKGSPIASGAAGCMDALLVPIEKLVGPELGLVALITGTILTFVVPFWLPVLAGILH